MHFADRNFYCDWWNANNIDTFWRAWNMPVHRWAVRHLYIPIVEMGYGKNVASITVFFVSAFFHEYLVSYYWTFAANILKCNTIPKYVDIFRWYILYLLVSCNYLDFGSKNKFMIHRPLRSGLLNCGCLCYSSYVSKFFFSTFFFSFT